MVIRTDLAINNFQSRPNYGPVMERPDSENMDTISTSTDQIPALARFPHAADNYHSHGTLEIR